MLDKRRLLGLYRRHVPDFPLKDFGADVVKARLQQTFPAEPCRFAPWQDHAAFEDQLAEASLAHIAAKGLGRAVGGVGGVPE